LRQLLCERQEAGLPCPIVCRVTHEYADPPHARARLLRTRRKRPRCRRAAAKQDDEIAPSYA
jgi:hypothetical protein